MLKSIFLILISFLIPLIAPAQETPPEAKGWTPWVSLGGQITSDPAACTAGDVTFVFARGTDNKIWFRKRFLPTGVWSPWKKIPDVFGPPGAVTFIGAPAAYCWKYSTSTSVLVSAIGSDNRVWSVNGWGTGSADAFSNWYQFPGFNSGPSGPALAGWGSNPIHHFARGGDNRIYMKTQFSGTTTPYRLLVSERVYNDPAAVMPSIDRLDFFYRDQYGRLWQQFMIGTSWQPRQLIPGATYSAPEVVSRDIYTLDLFARGYNNTLIHKRSVNGVWGSWVNLGGLVTSGPGATTYANNNRIFVFVRWSNGALYYRAWAP